MFYWKVGVWGQTQARIEYHVLQGASRQAIYTSSTFCKIREYLPIRRLVRLSQSPSFQSFHFKKKVQVQNNLTTVVSTMASEPPYPTISAGDHKAYMEYALERARLSPPASTKFCVGAVLVDADENVILSTGYSLELPRDSLGDPGTTHAEQCCFIKVAQRHNLPEERIGEVLPKNTVLYTTMEPCNKRLSGNRTCVERILRLNGAIKVVYVGIREPEVFVGENVGMQKLKNAGVIVEVVEGMQDRILQVSTAGHEVEKS